MGVDVRQVREGALLRVHVQPGAAMDRIRGTHGEALKVAVRAVPEKGRANEGLLDLLAGSLGVVRGAIEIVSGERAREKRVLFRGIRADALRARIEDALAREGGSRDGLPRPPRRSRNREGEDRCRRSAS